MKIYQFYDYRPDEEVKDVLVEWTEDDILDHYWNFWSERMIQKFGYGHELITKENCIYDWAMVNWAWEKKDESSEETN